MRTYLGYYSNHVLVSIVHFLFVIKAKVIHSFFGTES